MDRSLYAEALAPFEAQTRRLRPSGGEVFEAHAHLGLDEYGRSLNAQTLLAQLDAAGARRACVFPLHDPERKPAYRLPNDRVIEWAGESEGRLIPFCRLDPGEKPVQEGRRCIERGARGIKLHPRAQEFGFEMPHMRDVFALAEEASVPILIHAGRGMPPIADGLAELALRHPEVVLILAHAAICDQGLLTSRLADHPGVLYDTSCFFPVDVIALLARVPAERVVFASDPPYGLTSAGLYFALRMAAHAGLDERATQALLGETMAGLIDGRGLPPAGEPRGASEVRMGTRLARVYGYGSLAGPALFGGAREQAQAMLDLAISVCRDPQPGEEGQALDQIGAALIAARTLLGADGGTSAAIDLLYRSMALAATEPLSRPSDIAVSDHIDRAEATSAR
jgi:predicted TIM-barrel fold metal-dependent hydrolase